MTQKLQKTVKRHPLVAAFLIPLLGMTIIMISCGYTPFGKYSMLYSDMYHQYYPFFVSFRRALRTGQSLLYNWDVGMGMDFLGLYSYYLGSPLNFLSVLVPESLLLPYFSFLMPLKLSFASLFFAIFLKELFGRKDLSITFFGVFYGTCAWALGFSWNVMWLDTFALLPLVILGTVRLLRDKKVILYSISLFFSVVINYYIGFFTCIFVALFFFCYEICRWKGFGRFFADLGRIALFSLLAIAMTAVVELPTLAALQQTQSSVNAFPVGIQFNIAKTADWKGLFDAMRQVAGNMAGGLKPNFKEGLPNIYCGVLTVCLAFLFLFDRRVPLREKVCSVFLLLFFTLSFIIRQLDYIWHGFHFPNMIPYRFSFLFSFVLLCMAYRAWLMADSFRPFPIFSAGVATAVVFTCSDSRFDPAFLAYNLCFLILYTLSLIIRQMPMPKKPEEDPEHPEKTRSAMEVYEKAIQKHRLTHRTASWVLAAVMIAEIAANITAFGIYFPGTYVGNYPLGKEETSSMIRYMKEKETGTPFYRAEVTHAQTLNDGSLNNYYGISTFTSSANVHVTKFMKALGYGAKDTYNRYCFEESSPVANLLLGLKYMIARDGKVEDNLYFDDIHHFGNVHLLRNNAYLPLGFLAESALADVDFNHKSNNFLFQNQIFRAATGLTGSVWNAIPTANTRSGADKAAVIFRNTSSTLMYSEALPESTVSFFFTADRAGLACVDIDFPTRNSFSVWHNGKQLYTETISLPQMLSVCNVVPGDVIEIRAVCGDKPSGTLTVHAAILDDELFRKGYDILAASVWQLDSFTNTRVSGTVDCNRDGLLYTSVPQNGNWKVFVDGKQTESLLVGDAMVSVPLTEGTHEVTLVYENRAFNLGLKISLAAFLLLLGAFYLYRSPKNRAKGKYEK